MNARHFPRLLLATAFLFAASWSFAADTSVHAHLNRGLSVVGDPVELEIKISGAKQVNDPPDVSVDGLDVRFVNRGSESVMRFENGAFTSERTTTLIYQVVPQKNGSFTIPPITVVADGKSYTTQPVALKVQPNGSGDEDREKMSFAEIYVPKKTLYLGEAIPAELRLFVDSRVPWQPTEMPELGGDGFTKQKFPEPQKDQVERNQKDYDQLTFKTVITPIHAGKITVGPSELTFRARIPRAQRNNGTRSPFNPLGDIFNDPFFSATQEIKLKAPAVELTVKPLPQAGKPADFSGAVGTFVLSVEGSPKQVKMGDPVTMKMHVGGKGNFDRVTAPTLVDPTGWRSYPPSSTFAADDPANYSGTKTFEQAIIPETKKSAMPVFQFSYFDPVTEKYVTLNSGEKLPLIVTGDLPPAPAPVTAPVTATPPDDTPAPPKPPVAERRADDIVGLRYDRDPVQSFTPLYEQKEFWMAQIGAAVALAGMTALRLRRGPSATALEKSALRQEKDAAWRRLRGRGIGSVDFFDAAARVAQLDTAIATGRPVALIDAAAVRASAELDPAAATAIDDIFNARAELHYAGRGADGGKLPDADRERVLAALQQLEKSHARG